MRRAPTASRAGHNGGMDEFQFLRVQAESVGVTAIPPVRRLTHTLPDDRIVSALQFGDPATGAFVPPTVTFLHGAGLNAHTWDTTILALGLPALAVDLPGHGDSSWRTDAAYRGRTLAADLAGAVAGWVEAPQVLVGQSLGGLTAAALAAAHPELVRELIVVDISPGIDPNGGARQIAEFFAGPTDWASRDELLDRALAFGLGGSREAAARGVYLNSRVRDDGRVEWKHHFAHIAAAAAADPAAAAAALAGQDALRGALTAAGWQDLADTRAPVALVHGERGYLTGDDLAEFRERLPPSRLLALPTAHNVQEEAPAALAAAITALTVNR